MDPNSVLALYAEEPQTLYLSGYNTGLPVNTNSPIPALVLHSLS